MPTLLDLLRRFAAETPDAPCLTLGQETLTFGVVHRRSSQIANALGARGIRAGDRVAILARNSPLHYELFFACAKLGAIPLPLNWRLSAREIAGVIADAEPSLILIDGEFAPLLGETGSPPPEITIQTSLAAWRDAANLTDPAHLLAPDTPAVILYTSGTTGQPKGAVLSHGNLAFTERLARETMGFTAASVNLVASPLFHIGGIGYGMTALTQGGHTVLLQQPSPAAIIKAIRQHRVTNAFFVPTVIQMLVDMPGVSASDFASLQRIVYGASPISEALLARAIALMGCGFNHTYGLTESAGTVVALAPQEHGPHRLLSCGRAVPWVELALFDPATDRPVPPGEVGEIRLRSGTTMLGYWGKPAETAATITPDGWLRTGDAATQDADGFVFIHDRYKDMIVSGAENIYPTEIENVLGAHPAVAEVAVIGVPHERWGETPRAFVVARGETSEAELIAFTRERLARYKCPTSVAFVEVLPRNATGKVLKREMRGPEWAGR